MYQGHILKILFNIIETICKGYFIENRWNFFYSKILKAKKKSAKKKKSFNSNFKFHYKILSSLPFYLYF